MARKPFLIFPKPSQTSRTKKRGQKSSKGIGFPSKETQVSRLERKISNLETILKNQSMELSNSIEGYTPEMILVLEIAGTIDNFFKAVEKTPGMEFLLEYQDDLEADDDFYMVDENNERLEDRNIENGKRIFLSTTNAQALKELEKYWTRYKAGQNQERGFAAFGQLFEQLKDIRPYGVKDRVRDTGIEDRVKELKEYSEEEVYFEVELAYVQGNRQAERFRGFKTLVEQAGGQIIEGSKTTIDDIKYFGFIAKAPINSFDTLTEYTHVSFLKFNEALFFRPVGQVINEFTPDDVETVPFEGEITSIVPNDRPVVALLDGLPLAKHKLLRDKITIDDPFGFEQEYPAEARSHGTMMASLILNGDIGGVNGEGIEPLNRRILSVPIMKPNRSSRGEYREMLPEDRLPIDLVHQAVKRIKRLGGIGPDIKIINFSIGDIYRPFLRNNSTWARLLDWLSWKYDVLFIVSAGNYTDSVILNGISQGDFANLNSDEKQKLLLKKIVDSSVLRRIISPAESINAITVGSSHHDKSSGNAFPNRIDFLSNEFLPSPFSRIGFGYAGSIKPDILMPGGKKLYRQHPRSRQICEFNMESQPVSPYPPGNQVAVPGSSGDLNASAYTCGTSNAAALATRLGAMLYEKLLEINSEKSSDQQIPKSHFHVMLKALLVHGARWGEAASIFEEVVSDLSYVNSRKKKKFMSQYLGYGCVDEEKIMYCTEQRAILLGFGTLSEGKAHEFRFPLPSSLTTRSIEKTLVITLAWISPTNFNSHKYRQAHLFFDNIKDGGLLSLERDSYDFNTARKGTVQHDVLKGDKADAYKDGSELVVKVSCKEDASGLETRMKYGLAATLEVDQNTGINIYDEIRNRIQQKVKIKS